MSLGRWQSVALLLAASILLCGSGFLGVFRTHRNLQDLEARARTSELQLVAAKAHERALRDSMDQLDSERDASWSSYVRDLEARHQVDLQNAVRKASLRAKSEVAAKLGIEDSTQAPDTGFGRPDCQILLSCQEAASMLASDSLLRLRLDSVSSWTDVQAAACTTVVSQARAHGASAVLAVAHSMKSPWWERPTLIVSAAIAAILLVIAAR